MDEILLFLLKKGAAGNPVMLTTAELGAALGMSQQNASRRLKVLEESGKIKRTSKSIVVTEKGIFEARMLAEEITSALEKKLRLSGKIVDGVGEGRYYTSLPDYRQGIKQKLGFEPFPGTLNILLDEKGKAKRNILLSREAMVIGGFKTKSRSFGDIFAYRCMVDGVEGAVVIPLRSHHGPEILEIISRFNLRGRLEKNEGEEVSVEV